MYEKQKIKFISADSHFCEPDKFYVNNLPSNLRDESPRYIEIKKNLFWTDSYSLIPMSASIGAGTSNKKLKFSTPAFNFDEVSELPKGATLLASDKINKIMGVYFKSGNSEVWGLQYHPDYEYWQMINLASARKDRILENNHFNNETEFQNHLDFIKNEDKKLDFENRTCEVRNWLNYIKIN